jgi:hypothetical protein
MSRPVSEISSVPKFTEVAEYFAHSVKVHAYDVNIKLCHLPKRVQLDCSDISSIDRSEVSAEYDSRPETETPACAGLEITNIDPRLLGPQPVNTEPRRTNPVLILSCLPLVLG